eukprot:scaffold101016_cov63-Phaeocystis_antarctica.AAC.2
MGPGPRRGVCAAPCRVRTLNRGRSGAFQAVRGATKAALLRTLHCPLLVKRHGLLRVSGRLRRRVQRDGRPAARRAVVPRHHRAQPTRAERQRGEASHEHQPQASSKIHGRGERD